MEHEHSSHNLNAAKTIKANQNEDANAVAIDAMLSHLKSLLKKYLMIKKISKQLNESPTQITQDQVNEKIQTINQQTQNLTISLDRQIPPDKRMTNLLYMRILKQVSYFQKIIHTFAQIIPTIETLYNEQLKSNNFCILPLYTICEKKFIQQIKIHRLRLLHNLQERKMKFILDHIHQQKTTQQSQKEHHFSETNYFQSHSSEKTALDDFNRNIIEAILDIFVQKKVQSKKTVTSLHQIIQKGSNSIVLSDYRQRVTPIFQDIYSPLDIIGIQIVTLFIPTLRPEDNIELIYRKVSSRNKKSRKQIRQFQAQLSLYTHKKSQQMKRKARKSEIPNYKIQNSILPWSKLNHTQQTLSDTKHQEAKKYSYKTIDLLKPISENHKQRSISRFRQRFQQSIQNAKSISTTIPPNRSNNLAPIVSSKHHINQLQKKQSAQFLSREKKQNYQDHSNKQIKKQKHSKGKKFEIKPLKISEKLVKSLKNTSTKQSTNKKLRL